jgi:hypothetical protein
MGAALLRALYCEVRAIEKLKLSAERLSELLDLLARCW